mgnify:CR=1 FL=1
MQGLGNLLNMVCYAGIAAVLVMIALSKEKTEDQNIFRNLKRISGNHSAVRNH